MYNPPKQLWNFSNLRNISYLLLLRKFSTSFLNSYAFIALTLIAWLTAACSAPLLVAEKGSIPEQQASVSKSAKSFDKVKVLQLPFLSFAPFFIAQEEGYFADQGLEVEFIQMQQSTEAVPALIQGNLDVLAGFINIGLLNAMAQGENIRIVADKGYQATDGCSSEAFMLSSHLNYPQQPVAMDALGDFRFSINRASVEGFYIEKLLAPSNATLDDIQIEGILNPASELEALQQGAVDLAIVSEPWITQIGEAQAGVLWKSVGEVVPDFQSAVLVYGPRLLADDNEVGKRFMSAYLKAVAQYSEGKTDRNLAILASYTKLEESTLQKSCWPQFHSDGQINTTSIAEFANWAVAKGLLDQALSEEQFWDPRFVAYADQQK